MRFIVKTLVMITLMSGLNGCGENKDKSEPETEGVSANFQWPDPPILNNPTETLIFQTNLSEDMILDLSPGLKLLAKKFEGGEVKLGPLFTEPVAYLGPSNFDLRGAIETKSNSSSEIVYVSWPIDDTSSRISPEEVWAPIVKEFKFEDTQFGVLAGIADQQANVFRMKTVFEGRFRDAKNRLFGVKAKQTLDWIPVDDHQWKIAKWKQESLEITFSPKALFENVTDRVIPDDEVRELLSRSPHEDIIHKRFEKATTSPIARPEFPHFSDWESSYQYPAASVVDVDGDQWDDLFVLDRWGKSILLRNNEGNTFTDITESSGLMVDEFANCALFADFDNDGDSDVFVGRTLKPSLFFRNENGTFVPDETVNENLKDVKFVVAGSLADINRDGLLDIFLSTYCFTGGDPDEWVPQVVRLDEELKFKLMIERNNPFLDRGGPPNIVLMNRGGVLERPTIDNTLKQWRSSYQPVWHDIDQDGDSDLYVCNDFSPDVFLRNDTVRGSFKPKFSDFTEQVFPGGNMAFGMGASFGDYNSDGQLDLYVSNMYSKAGLRIVEKLGGEVDPRIKVSAQGNFLYENRNGVFSQVAGLDDNAQHVSKVGWSFGGQLADFNNDTNLDLYVPSGLFSAPKILASTVDL